MLAFATSWFYLGGVGWVEGGQGWILWIMISLVIKIRQNEWTHCMGCCGFCWVCQNLRWQTIAFSMCWCNLRGRGWGQCRCWEIQGMTLGRSVLSAKYHGENIVEWGNRYMYCTRCRTDEKIKKLLFPDPWLTRGSWEVSFGKLGCFYVVMHM